MYLHIAVPRPLEDTFIYKCPPEMEGQISVGKRVIAPFGRQMVTGYIINTSKELPTHLKPEIKQGQIKPISSILDATPLIDKTMLDLCKWASEYYLFPLGMVLKTALSGIPEEKELRPPKKSYNILDLFKDKTPFADKPRDTVAAPPILTPHQEGVLSTIRESLKKGDFSVHLLHGITGSGKTEIYMHSIDYVTKSGKSSIVLVPEIAITPQLITRFFARFKERVAVLHSGLTHNERIWEWLKIMEGKVDVIIGVRAAVFAPVKNLGLVVIDEEHEHSFKQEDGFRYNARDLAIMRAKLSRASVILGSATPSLESFYNTTTKKYIYLSLPERINRRPLPPVRIVDMRKKEGFSIFTDELLEALKQRLNNGEQSLLFLNRRGFSPFLLCLDCGYSPECPNCSVSLTYHKSDNSLHCHYCDYRITPPDTCSKCSGHKFRAFGAGTQRVEEELKKIIPGIRVVRMDRDTTTKRHSHHQIFKSMENKEADVLIGTQMVTKGLDLPEITLVGVLFADSSLHLPDFRSAERTFQFITQVAGRSGRGDKVGEVIVQTFNPDHYSIRYASMHDFEGFYKEESSFRKTLGYPPYKRLVRILIKGNNKELVESSAERFKAALDEKRREGTDILGPVPAPLIRIRGKFRWHIIMKANDSRTLNRIIKNSLKAFNASSKHKHGLIEIDVDPLNLL
ncbi:MAG TPA: primosomal protein N' [Nitrospiraceae bacterium]|nr:primosomal protein N' [Nitrospiraceae bacterium]